MSLFEWKHYIFHSNDDFFFTQYLFLNEKRCHLMTFSWRLESKRTRARGKRNHKFRAYDFLKSKSVLECQNWCLNLKGTLLLYNRGKCEKSAFKTMKKPSQCHEKHWTSKLWHMGQDLLHSSSVAHVQIRGIFLMQMAIGTCIHYWWFIRNNDLFTVFGLDNVCFVWSGEAAWSIKYIKAMCGIRVKFFSTAAV